MQGWLRWGRPFLLGDDGQEYVMIVGRYGHKRQLNLRTRRCCIVTQSQ